MMMDAKKQTLRQIMDLMDGHRMGGLRKKGAPAEMPASPEAPVEAAAIEAPQDEMDDMAKQQLMEMYGKDDEFEPASRPVSISGVN